MGALIVEDDGFTADVIRKTLERAHYDEILHAGSGGEALMVLDEAWGSIKLVVLDLVLPDADAFVLLKGLGEKGYCGQILFVSGANPRWLQMAEESARRRGMTVLGSYQKPFSVPAMINTLSQPRLPQCENRSQVRRINATDLQHALSSEQIQAVYQPKVSVANGELKGFEALARWHHPEFGPIPADLLIDQIEAHGLIDELTHVILDQALQTAAEVHERGLDCSVSVNISGASLDHAGFADALYEKVVASQLRPEKVILELTESQATRNTTEANDTLSRLGLRGFSISVDDYGMGYSNLERLRSMAFSELKLDRSFVHGANHQPNGRAILGHCVNLGHELGLSVVAEGVESQEDWDLIQSAGCDLAQGYLISAPLNQAELLRWAAVSDLPMQHAWLGPDSEIHHVHAL